MVLLVFALLSYAAGVLVADHRGDLQPAMPAGQADLPAGVDECANCASFANCANCAEVAFAAAPFEAFGLLVGLLGLVGVLVSAWLAAEIWALRRVGTRSAMGALRPRVSGARWAGLLVLCGLFYVVGWAGLDAQLSAAASDRAAAERAAGAAEPSAVRIARATVASRRPGAWGDRIELEAVVGVDGGVPLPRRILLRLDHARASDSDSDSHSGTSRADRLLWPGATVRLGLRVRPLRAPRNPGSRDRERIAARRGLGAEGRLIKSDWVMRVSADGVFGRHAAESLARRRARWRKEIADGFGERKIPSGLVRALVLGDREGLSPSVREAFRRLGLSHLLAISGLHVGFVAALAGWIALRTGLRLLPRTRDLRVFQWALAFASGVSCLYAWLTDAGVSVERATLLFSLFALCRLALWVVKPQAALATVALVLLIREPEALFDLGAQLSFMACAALILAGFWQSAPLRPVAVAVEGRGGGHPGKPKDDLSLGDRIRGVVRSTFQASLVVSIGTAPLAAQHGLTMTALAPVFNIAAIPYTGFVVLPCSFVAVLGLGVLPERLLRGLVWPAQAFETSALATARLLPAATGEPALAMPVFLGLVLVAGWLAYRAQWKQATLVWAVAATLSAAPIDFARRLPDRPRVIFFDVGQGDATLVESRSAVVLIDTGPGPPDASGGGLVVRGLRAAGVSEIDVLVLTHADLDHRGGLTRVLAEFPVAELWLPVTDRENAALSAAALDARRRGTRVIWQATGDSNPAHSRVDEGLAIEVLWPLRAAVREKSASHAVVPSSRNQNSIVLQITLESSVFLFTGDIDFGVERELIERVAPLRADVLKVAHHGSARSSSAAFLAAVSPDVAVVSAPCEAARGLPNRSALQRVERSGAALWWTGRDGAVVVAARAGGSVSESGWGRRRVCRPR